jgi:hypothetical protein
MTQVQALLFDRDHYDEDSTLRWLDDHGYHPLKLHTTPKFVRARLMEPPAKPMRIIDFGKHIRAIVVLPKNTKHMERHGKMSGRSMVTQASKRGKMRGGGWGYLDAHPNLIGDIVTTGLAGLAAYGIYRAVKAKQGN